MIWEISKRADQKRERMGFFFRAKYILFAKALKVHGLLRKPQGAQYGWDKRTQAKARDVTGGRGQSGHGKSLALRAENNGEPSQ